METLFSPDFLAAGSAFLQVMMIDLVLAGDNAVAVGLAAGGLPAEQRRKVIMWGLAAAVVMRIGFALITTQLLGIIGLLFGGGILLLWVCWKMWREMREQATHAQAEAISEDPPEREAKTFKAAFLQILIADLSMSLDNVLAVAGAAREHPSVLVFGLIFSIALMGIAASWIANLLQRYRWIGYVGLVIVLYVALHMMWEGHRDAIQRLGYTPAYNAAAPDFLDIKPGKH
ncbi:MAG: TerC family protein [Phenylobacterium sp.]|uniref:TerC family protein n=1 Tax=Phenylobacterium sp. TaxID=1871053 RepID=UPI00273117BA|nr:TerC family protein [Phenylobacterium sp.]MDP2010183.1 TerC family protein [Phenylobacterium sp.]MDP3631672.1 TerC family protein [Phenylobacterium sp.]MDP3870380.1 TerC family protein [Phenylobacterium sp.]